MTWSKVNSSTVITDNGAAGLADTKQYEKWDEIFGWLTSRGWVVTARGDNNPGATNNYWSLDKSFVSYEGQAQSSKWLASLTNSGASSQVYWYNGRGTSLANVNISATTYLTSYYSDVIPDGFAGAAEMWVSDEDPDSYLLLCVFGTGERRVIGLSVGGNARRNADTVTATNYGSLIEDQFPIFDAKQIITSTVVGQLAFGEVTHQHLHHTSSLPVITNGEVSFHDSVSPRVKWRQPDVGMLEDFSVVQQYWQPNLTGHLGTIQIDGDYHIVIGDPSGYGRMLLNCGTSNPGINA